MSIRGRVIYIFLFFICLSIGYSIDAQDHILKTPSDAINTRKKADKLNTEALDLYIQVQSLKGDGKDEKAEKVNQKARETDIEALNLYFKANEIEFESYSQQVNDEILLADETDAQLAKLQKDFATDTYNQAKERRLIAQDLEDQSQKIEKLRSALKQENTAIVKLKEAFTTLTGTVSTGRPIPSDSLDKYTADYSPVHVAPDSAPALDFEMIERIRKYMSMPEPDSTLLSLRIPSSFNYGGIREFLERYRKWYDEEVPSASTNENMDLMAETDDYKNPDQDETSKTEDQQVSVTNSEKNKTSISKNDAKPLNETKTKQKTTKNTAGNHQVTTENTEINTDDIFFIVQVAASKFPMSEEEISRVYPGPYEVKMRQEEGWYKYQIGESHDYSKAREILDQTSVHGAFIAAYQDGQKLVLWKTLLELQNKGDIDYYIQLAASAFPMSDEQKQRLYNGSGNLREIKEDHWYKYQVYGGKTYNEARMLQKEIQNEGAFIVAYRNNQKLNILTAIAITDR